MARIVLCGWALAVAVLATAALPQRANAQTFTASKNFCIGTPGYASGQTNPNTCPLATIVGAGVPAFYVITVTNPPSQPAQQITLNENFPTGFQPPNVISCTDQSGNSVSVSLISSPSTYSFSLAATTTTPLTVTCTITGMFSSSVIGQSQSNTGTLTNGSGGASVQTNTVNTFVAANTKIPTDLSVSKKILSVVTTSGKLPATVTYQIVVTNLGPNQFDNSGNWFVLHDTLISLPNSVPLQATVVGAPTCTFSGGALCPTGTPVLGGGVINSAVPTPLLDWRYSSGTTNTFPVGSSITVTITVQISQITGLNCIIALNSDGLNNQAFFTLTNATTNSAATDINPANDTTPPVPLSVITGATTVNPNCGTAQLDLQKTQLSPPNNVLWGSTVNYQITITNNSNPKQPITINSLQDLVAQGSGTPPFLRTFEGWSCSPTTICNAFTGAPALPGATFNYSSYWQSNPGWSSTTPLVLQYGQSVTIDMAFKYSNPDCTTVPSVTPEPIINTAVITYDATPVGQSTGVQKYTQLASVVTDMQTQPTCPFTVSKALISGGPNVQFGQPLVYNVAFTNNGAATTVGTVLDSIRLTDPAYGTPVPVTGSWTCSTSTGVTTTSTSTGVTGFPATGTIAGQAIYTPLPPQGAPIFQFTNLTFPQNSTLSCTITITVQQPSLNNPNCSATPTYFENLALMDVTNPYNPNVQWPPSGTYTTGGSSPPPKQFTNWQTVDAQLPQCYDVILNKTASVDGVTPAWTTPNGPAVNYAITVTNTGTGTTALTGSAPMGGAWNGLLLTDTFTATPYSNDLINPASCGSWCTLLVPPNGSSPYNPSSAGVKSLAPGANGVWNLTLNPTPNQFVVGQTINNCATVTPSAPFVGPGTFTGPGWYANYSNPNPPPNPPNPPQKACASVPVLATATVDVFKTVANNTGATINLPPTPFTGGVSCGGYPLLPALTPGDGNWTQTIPTTTLLNGKTVTSTTAAVIPNVPVYPSTQSGNETCNVNENTPPPVPVAALRACPGEFASWGTPTILWEPGVWAPPGPPVPNMPQPVNITTAGQTYSVNVTNPLNCLPTANLVVTKTVVNETGKPLTIPATPPMTFTASVGCGPTSLVLSGKLSLTVPAGPWPNGPPGVSSPTSSPVLVPVAAGENCTVTETGLPAVPIAAQQACSGPVMGSAGWYTTITPPQPITNITAGTTYAVTITNTLRCQGLLTVRKVVANDVAGVGSKTSFTINVTCTPPAGSGGVTTSYTRNVLGGATAAPPITNLMVGTVCTFAESPPTATFIYKGQTCTWQTPTYSPSSVTIGLISNIETVTNSYICQGQTTGTLTLVKTADYDGNALAASPVTVSIQVSCTNPTTTQTVNITVNNNGTFSQTAPNPIAVGSTCTITELPVAGWINCWATSYPLGQTITIKPGNQVLQVVNEELCSGNIPAGQVGVGIIKTPVIDGLVNYTPGVAFPITANCKGPNGGNGANMSFSAETGGTFTSGVQFGPPGTTCTISEPPPPLPPGDSACSWQTSYLYNGTALPGVTNPVAAGTPVTITINAPPGSNPYNLLNIQNQLICPAATLQVTKTVVNETGQTVNLPATTFTANVGCGPSSQPLSVNLPLTIPATPNWTPGLPGEVSSTTSQAVAVGENCTVTEPTLPAVPSGVMCQAAGVAYAASWTTTITPPQPMPITAAGRNMVTVTNMLSCNPLTVTKLVPNDFAGVASSTQFPITVKCTAPSGVTTTYPPFDVYDNATVPLLATLTPGTKCTFSESPVPATFTYNAQTCTWQTPTYSQQPLTIAQGPNNETVTNFYKCQGPAAVKPGACTPPMIPGPTPNSCVCPEGMQLQRNQCVVVQKLCPPPMIAGAAPNSCVCPPPMIAGPTPNSCRCPEGTVLQGNECVRPIVCKPPQVLNAAGTACGCPEGTVLRGNECVRPIVCKPPQVLNPAGTACGCPQGTVLRGNECVRPIVCKPPQVLNPAGTACGCPEGTVLRGNECVRSGPGGGPGRGGEQPGGGPGRGGEQPGGGGRRQ
jgi:hypothetical protein